MAKIKSFGSLCSGIEAASFVFEPMGITPVWFSEIAAFPSVFLKQRFPQTNNVGDMNDIPTQINNHEIEVPDLLCGGTPCQAFSLAGWKNGLNDHRGQLTLKYIEILDSIDEIRKQQGKDNAVFFWENVEGVLKDKTNAFGCFIAGLAGLSEPINVQKWSSAGIVHGPKRNIAWRVLDAKFFGLPQQRKRLYVLGGGKDYCPETALFEVGGIMPNPYKTNNQIGTLNLFDTVPNQEVPTQLVKTEAGNKIEIFRTYTDCLYAAYGTKWNGNAAAYNGSLYISQNDRLRRLTPRECERLMGFPDDYTLLKGCRDTNRYQAVGNSWAVNVIKWIAERIVKEEKAINLSGLSSRKFENAEVYMLDDFNPICNGKYLNAATYPYNPRFKNFLDVVDITADEKFYITLKGCAGILRRKKEKSAGMNVRLEQVLENICKTYIEPKKEEDYELNNNII